MNYRERMLEKYGKKEDNEKRVAEKDTKKKFKQPQDHEPKRKKKKDFEEMLQDFLKESSEKNKKVRQRELSKTNHFRAKNKRG